MPIQELTSIEIDSLVGTRHAVAGFEYPPNGLQPYYEWLIRTLHLLAESSLGALRVCRDGGSGTSVLIAPGRASISGVVLECAGQTLELAAYNNDTVYLWLFNDAGQAGIGAGLDGIGWPGTAHLKLAEVTIASGQITQILDRRIEHIFSV